MKNSKALKATLLISGLIATGIGGAILFMPVTFSATSGIDLKFIANISLLSEIRSAGGAMFASGILIMSGTFIKKLTFTSAVISSYMYLSYGAARIFSIVMDGVPTENLVQAAILEIVIGAICLFALVKYQENV